MSSSRPSFSSSKHGQAFFWKAGEGQERPSLPHSHQHPEVQLVTAGQGTCLIGEKKMDLMEGSLLFIAPKTEHMVEQSHARFSKWVIWPQGSWDMPVSNDVRHLRRKEQQLLVDALKLMVKLPDAPELQKSAFETLLGVINHGAQIGTPGTPAERLHAAVRKAMSILQSESMDTSTLAKKCGLSRPHLSKIFREQTGMSLSEYRKRSMLKVFFALQASKPNHTLLDLALETGFNNYMQFYRCHMDIMGYRPKGEEGR